MISDTLNTECELLKKDMIRIQESISGLFKLIDTLDSNLLELNSLQEKPKLRLVK